LMDLSRIEGFFSQLILNKNIIKRKIPSFGVFLTWAID